MIRCYILPFQDQFITTSTLSLPGYPLYHLMNELADITLFRACVTSLTLTLRASKNTETIK